MKRERHYMRGFVQRADGQAAEGGPLTIVAATEGRKGDGLNLTMDGADLARFETNPVVGYGHSYWGRDGLPIGRADKTWVDGERLMMDIVFDQGDDFARRVEEKYRGGFMNAFSIGFSVWNIDDAGVPEGWELFEVSAVPLPMDPNAVVESGRAADVLLAELGLTDMLRAGAVLSKKNKALVQSARDALTELLDAAGSTDDEGRVVPGGLTAADAVDLERLRANEARMRRLAGLPAH